MEGNLSIFSFNLKLMNYSTFSDSIKKKPYFFFILKLLLFSFIVYLMDFSIGSILNYFYFKQKSGFEFRTTYSIEKTSEDILIFGSSRASHHYDPDIFEKRLKMPCYNVGRDGNFMIYHCAILHCVLKRYTPKIIVLDFSNEEFKKDTKSYDRISTLLPYYKTHPEIRSFIELKSKFEKEKLLSKIYPFNSSIFKIFINNTDFNKDRKSPDIKGYIPLKEILNKPINVLNKPEIYELDSIKINVYDNFIKDCKKAGVELFVFVSPYFSKSLNLDYSVEIAREVAARNNIKFYDYSRDTLFTNKNLFFFDERHLNDNGAKFYSNLVVDRIVNRR